MIRSTLISLLVLSACADPTEEKYWGVFQCDVMGGHIETLQYCVGESGPTQAWATFYSPGRAQSVGEIRHGMLLPAHTQWWEKGELASRIEDDKLTIWDQDGLTVWASHPAEDGVAVACPQGATGRDEVVGSGHRSTWCEVTEGEEIHKIGLQTTYYASGKPESRMLWVRPSAGGESARHGLFVAWHDNGGRWIQGEYVRGKRHGHWLQWNREGAVYQQMVVPEWADTKPIPTWYDPDAAQVVKAHLAQEQAIEAAAIEVARRAAVPVGDCGPFGVLRGAATGGLLDSDQVDCLNALVSVEGAMPSFRARAAALLWMQAGAGGQGQDAVDQAKATADTLTERWSRAPKADDRVESKELCTEVHGSAALCGVPTP